MGREHQNEEHRQHTTAALLPSYQVLDATGHRTDRIRLPEWRDFRRSSWLVRKYHSFVSSKPRESLSMGDAKIDTVEICVNKALEILKHTEEHSLTYEDSLEPLFALNQTTRPTPDLFCILIRRIITGSAEFLQKSASEPEGELLAPREHYRALTNYWVYLMIEEVLNDTTEEAAVSKNAAYAYSFLYPYFDDLLDVQMEAEEYGNSRKASLVSNITKQLKSGRLTQQLAFQGCGDGNILRRERRAYVLLDKAVHLSHPSQEQAMREAGININCAQLASMKQRVYFPNMRVGIRSLSKDAKRQIFDITINKGAASVFPNAYLRVPSLTKEQAEIIAIIGYMTQFINDIEGLFDDLENKSLTPALISYLKHGNLDIFVECCLTHIEVLNHRAPSQFPSLPQCKVQLLLKLLRTRVLTTVALVHERSEDARYTIGVGVLSPRFIRVLERRIGFPLLFLASLARFEQEVFGGSLDSGSNEEKKPAHQLSTPSQFRSYILDKAEEGKKMGIFLKRLKLWQHGNQNDKFWMRFLYERWTTRQTAALLH